MDDMAQIRAAIEATERSLFDKFAKYAVPAKSIADFLERYYKADRYTGRGETYAADLLASYEERFQRDGYVFISHHDSVNGRIVSFYGPGLVPCPSV